MISNRNPDVDEFRKKYPAVFSAAGYPVNQFYSRICPLLSQTFLYQKNESFLLLEKSQCRFSKMINDFSRSIQRMT